MLKTMSSMLDNPDTQMVDYVADIDMQVQAFSSEPWLHDEVKMEEDAPGLKLENLSYVKEDNDQGDLTIEIDMEEHNTAEYDMVDDEQLHEILDVEVYDASLAHSPAMGVFDSVLPAEPTFPIPPADPQETDVTTVPELVAASVAPPVLAPISEDIAAAPVPDSHHDASSTDETPNTVIAIHQSVTQEAVESLENAPDEAAPPVDPEYPPSTGADPVKERSQEEVSEPSSLPDLPSHFEDSNSAVVVPDEGLPPESLETAHTSTSTSDPHEISEGVYIDPPPAVLLSISSDDQEHEFSLFNEPAEWSAEHHPDAHHTLLHHLPTMYYESLFSLFEALRQDEFIQSTFHLLEVELVLQAVDLALTISEDNVYSRDVSLHDLNMLHDGSGIRGPLRTKLYASTPRFIMRYQQLQEHVSRLQLGHQSRGAPFGGHTDDDQRPDLGPTADYQEVPTEESEPGSASTETLTNGEKRKAPEEPAETETHVPQQTSQSERVPDPHEEAEHEAENSASQDAQVEGRGSRSEEDSPTDSYPTVEDNDHDTLSAHTEGDTAVIGLGSVEAEVVDPQRDEDEHGVLYDGSEEGDELEPENEPDNFLSSQRDSSSQVAGGKDEVDQEPEEGVGEQGDEIFHENLEYAEAEAEAESEPLPDQFQALPQDVDDEHHQSEGYVTKIDHTTLFDNADGQEYNEEEPLPELPTDPISFDDESWGQELQEFENGDESWNGGDENEQSVSNHSSVTLSSRGSKRTFDDYESGGEGYDEEDQQWELPPSPDPKRTRTQ